MQHSYVSSDPVYQFCV